MQTLIDYWQYSLEHLTPLSMFLRFLSAAIAGAVVGYTRGKTQHAAGLRTHILVCLGAAAAMIINEYLVCERHLAADAARIPAQVVSGIGFLGAGSIIVTGRNHVTGLTTAAGLWASACMGLAAGAGYFSCVLIMCLLIWLTLELLHKVDKHYIRNSKQMYLYLETEKGARLGPVLSLLRENQVQIYSFDHFGANTQDCVGYRMNLEIENRQLPRQTVIELVSSVPGILYVSEL